MARFVPIAPKESTAAQLFDMSVSEFRAAVASGQLPDGKVIAGEKRWNTRLLEQIVAGDLIDGDEDIEW